VKRLPEKKLAETMSSKWPEQQLGQQEHQVCPRLLKMQRLK